MKEPTGILTSAAARELCAKPGSSLPSPSNLARRKLVVLSLGWEFFAKSIKLGKENVIARH